LFASYFKSAAVSMAAFPNLHQDYILHSGDRQPDTLRLLAVYL